MNDICLGNIGTCPTSHADKTDTVREDLTERSLDISICHRHVLTEVVQRVGDSRGCGETRASKKNVGETHSQIFHRDTLMDDCRKNSLRLKEFVETTIRDVFWAQWPVSLVWTKDPPPNNGWSGGGGSRRHLFQIGGAPYLGRVLTLADNSCIPQP